jgi:hypothetical protein
MKMLLMFVLLIGTICFAQDTNKVVTDESSGKPMLLGPTTKEAFQDTSFAWWYDSHYDMYEVDSAIVDEFKDYLRETDITIVLGTWCGDSRRELPPFLKILEYAGYPEDRITMISVDRKRQAEDIDIEAMDIRYVPTFIFYIDDEEIGRIIESPKETLEIDMAEILR